MGKRAAQFKWTLKHLPGAAHVPCIPLPPRAQQPPPPHLLRSDPEAVALLCRFGADLSYSVPSARHRKTSVLTAALLVEDPEARSQIVLTLLQV